jgi:hypothetical protein
VRFKVALWAWLLFCSSDARAQNAPHKIVLLPLNGSVDICAPLEESLGGALKKKIQARVIEAEEMKQQLLALSSEAQVVGAAQRSIASSEEASLYMKKAEALSQAQQALNLLESDLAQFHHPSLVSRAYGALAFALLLEPADEEAAVKAWHQSLELDPTYKLDPDRLTPVVRALFLKAQDEWQQRPLVPPKLVLKQTAEVFKAENLAWVAIRLSSPGNARLFVALIDSRGEITQQHQVQVELEKMQLQTAKWIAQAFQQKPSAPKVRVVVEPWYRKWWIWTIAGAAVTGAGLGLGLGLGLSASEPSTYDIHLQFKN